MASEMWGQNSSFTKIMYNLFSISKYLGFLLYFSLLNGISKSFLLVVSKVNILITLQIEV